MSSFEQIKQGQGGASTSVTAAQSWYVSITDGTTVIGTSSHPVYVTGSFTNPSVSATGSAVPADATYVGAHNPSGNLTGLNVDVSGNLLVAATGTVAVTQSTSPWVVSGTVTANQGGSWTVAATQSGSWTVAATQSGSWTVAATQSGSWTVAATQSGTWTVQQGGAPWTQNVTQFGGYAVVVGTGPSGSGIPRVTVSNDSAVKVWDGTDTLAIDSTGAVSGNITEVSGTSLTLGQKTMANSVPVAIASDQTLSVTVDAVYTEQTGEVDSGTIPTSTDGTLLLLNDVFKWSTLVLNLQASGAVSPNGLFQLEGSTDNSFYVPLTGTLLSSNPEQLTYFSTTGFIDASARYNLTGYPYVRLHTTNGFTGTINVSYSLSTGLGDEVTFGSTKLVDSAGNPLSNALGSEQYTAGRKPAPYVYQSANSTIPASSPGTFYINNYYMLPKPSQIGNTMVVAVVYTASITDSGGSISRPTPSFLGLTDTAGNTYTEYDFPNSSTSGVVSNTQLFVAPINQVDGLERLGFNLYNVGGNLNTPEVMLFTFEYSGVSGVVDVSHYNSFTSVPTSLAAQTITSGSFTTTVPDSIFYLFAVRQFVASATVSYVAVSGTTATVTFTAPHNFVINETLVFSGLSNATWLNGLLGIVASITSTTVTFSVPSGHSGYGNADSGTAGTVNTFQPYQGAMGPPVQTATASNFLWYTQDAAVTPVSLSYISAYNVVQGTTGSTSSGGQTVLNLGGADIFAIAFNAAPTTTIVSGLDSTGTVRNLSTDSSGYLNVNASFSGTVSGNAAASATGAAVPAAADYQGVKVGSNLVGRTGLSLGSQVAATVAIVDGSGNQITTFGSGGGYTVNTAQTTPSGVLGLGWDAGGTVRGIKTDSTGATIVVNAGTFAVQASQAGSWTTNTNIISSTLTDPAELTPGSTTTPNKVLVIGGKTADVTPVYSALPLAAGGGAVVVTVSGGSVGNPAAGNTGSAVPTEAGYTGLNVSGTLRGATGLSVGSQYAQTMALVDASGNQITSFGGSGGTQYAEGTTAATATGTVMLGKNSTTLKALQTDASGNLVVVGTGTFAVQASQSTAANLNATVVGTGTFAVQAASTQSGTWNVRTQDGSGNSLSSTGGSLNVNITGGSTGNAAASNTGSAVPAQADYQGVKVGSNLVGVTGFTLGSSTAEAVAIVDGSGNQITSFGGGTQYAAGTVVATPTGTVALSWDGNNVRALNCDGVQNLKTIDANLTPTFDFVSHSFTSAPATMGFSTFGKSLCSINVSGTWSGAISFSATIDNSHYFNVTAYDTTGALVSSVTSNGTFFVPCSGYYGVSLSSSGTWTGTANVAFNSVFGAYLPNPSSSSGGVQYAEGATAATATGTVSLGKNGTTVKAIQTDASGNLVVVQSTAANLNATVTGTVAATQSGSWTVSATQSGTWNIGTLSTITNPVTVSQGTAANLNATVVGTGTFAVQAAQSGTWNVGTVSTVTAVTSITNDVATRPAAPTTAKWTHAFGSTSSSGDTSVISGVTGQTIRIYKINIVVNGPTNIYFLDSTPNRLSATYILTGNGSSFSDSADGEPLWIGASGKGFEIDSSSAVTLNWEIWYSIS